MIFRSLDVVLKVLGLTPQNRLSVDGVCGL